MRVSWPSRNTGWMLCGSPAIGGIGNRAQDKKRLARLGGGSPHAIAFHIDGDGVRGLAERGLLGEAADHDADRDEILAPDPHGGSNRESDRIG